MPVPGAARSRKLTRPKKMYQFERIVGASPDLATVKARPDGVAVTLPAVVFQAVVSRPEVVKSWV